MEISPYARQYNDPNDLYRKGWNESQVLQQHRLSQLSGGSWSQPPWNGWFRGAGHQEELSGSWFRDSSLPPSFLQRFAQDGDSGFFYHGRGGLKGLMAGRGLPVGMSPLPPNHLPEDDAVRPLDLPEATVSTAEPVITEPPSMPRPDEIISLTRSNYEAEPEQHALHVPPFSHLLRTGFGKDSALYEEPLEFPEYKGSLHKKKKTFSK